MKRRRHELCDGVRLGKREVHDTAHVANGGSGCHGAEGDDLRDVILAVFLPDIVDDLAPSRIAEVHIDIRHGHAGGVQEAFEIEAIFHGVNFGNMQAVSHHRACCAAASGADRDPGGFCKAHEIPHDEEVVRKAHFLDHVDLIFQLLHILRVRRAVQLVKALFAELVEIRKARHALRKLEFRQEILAERELHIAALRDPDRILKRLRHVREEAAKLLFALEIEFLRLKFHAVWVVDGLAGLDAEQHVLHFCVCLAQIVCVVRHDKREVQFFSKLTNMSVDGSLLRNAVILQFQIKMPRAENFRVFTRGLLRRVQILLHDRLRDTARKAGGERDQALVMLPQQFHIHAGAVVKPFGKAERNHIAEVPVAHLVFTEQDQMVWLLIDAVNLVKARPARNIDLAADNGLDPGLFRCAVKIDGTVHDAVVGQGDGVLAELLHPVHHGADAAGSVKQAVFTVDVQMYKGHGSFLLSAFVRKRDKLAHTVVHCGFGNRRVLHGGKFLQRCFRIIETELCRLAELRRQLLESSLLLKLPDGCDLLNRRVDHLGQICRFAVDAAVDAVAKILFDLRLHHAHCAHRRADGRQKILDHVALLEIQNAVAAARRFLRGKSGVEQQRAGFAADLIVRGRQLQVVALGRVRDRAAGQKRAAQKRQPLFVLLQHPVIDVQRHVSGRAEAELRKHFMDFFL